METCGRTRETDSTEDLMLSPLLVVLCRNSKQLSAQGKKPTEKLLRFSCLTRRVIGMALQANLAVCICLVNVLGADGQDSCVKSLLVVAL